MILQKIKMWFSLTVSYTKKNCQAYLAQELLDYIKDSQCSPQKLIKSTIIILNHYPSNH